MIVVVAAAAVERAGGCALWWLVFAAAVWSISFCFSCRKAAAALPVAVLRLRLLLG